MAQGTSFFFFFMLFLCNTGLAVTSSYIPLHHAKHSEIIWEKKQLFPSFHRALIEYFRYRITQHDSLDPPTTPIPSPSPPNPITNPVTNPSPGIVTVPGTNPVNPPVTNPVTPPVTNPVNPPVTNPPVPVSTTPTGSGQWCIAKSGASQAALQVALDYACGTGGVDCASIQHGSSCYEPANLQNHASYAFNSYYQKNPDPQSCDFGGAAAITSTNPSTGSCVYPLSSSSSSSAPPVTTQAPVNPTSLPTAPPTTSSSGPRTQYPPPPAVPGSSIGSPDPTGLGAFGANPPLVNMPSTSNNLRPFIDYLLTMSFIIMFGL